MRPLYVSVRVATAALAVAAVAGCMSVSGDAGGRAKPSHPVKQEGGEVPDGGAAVGGTFGHRPTADGTGGLGKRSGKESGKESGDGGAASPGASPSAEPSRSAPVPGGAGGSVGSVPPRTDAPTPTGTAEPQPTPTKEPSASPTPEPTVAEPSSSAPEPTGSQMSYREPAPEAGVPA